MDPPAVVGDGVLPDRMERNVDAGLVLEQPVERLLQLLARDLAEEAAAGAAALAAHRGATAVNVNDLSTYLSTQWGMKVPGFRSETTERLEELMKDMPPAVAHRARMELKATLRDDAAK